MARPKSSPPGPAERLIERAVSTQAARHGVLGDLEEEYHRRLVRRPRFVCDLWYWGQALLVWTRYRWENARGGSVGEAMNVTGLGNDVRFALGGLFRAPGFTVITIGTLALGIGATTAIFTVVNGVLLKPLPFEDQDELGRS